MLHKEGEPTFERRLLVGKTALITGGASGIGKATAEVFLREGAKVSIFDTNAEKLQAALTELTPHESIIGFDVDIRNPDAINAALKRIEDEFGPVTTLVNNAGINPHHPLAHHPEALWEEIMGVNFTGTRMMTQTVGERMRDKNIPGSIVFVTSIHTLQAFPGDAAYDSSKHALIGLMGVAAIEWGQHGIRCNAVAPGAIYPTGITQHLDAQTVHQVAQKIPLRRMGKPSDIAEVIAFVSSDRASYMHGEEIRVDGGLARQNPLTG